MVYRDDDYSESFRKMMGKDLMTTNDMLKSALACLTPYVNDLGGGEQINCGKCGEPIWEDGIRTLCEDCLEDLYIDFTDRMEEMLEGYNVAQLEALKSGKMYESLKFRIADRIDYMKRMRD